MPAQDQDKPHSTGCACRTCAELQKRVSTEEKATGRYEIRRETEEGTMTLGWQMRPYGSLYKSAQAWPGTTAVVIVDRCRVFIPDTDPDNPRGFTLPQIAQLERVKVTVYPCGSTLDAPWNYTIVTGGMVMSGAPTLEECQANALTMLERMNYLWPHSTQAEDEAAEAEATHPIKRIP